MGLSFCTSEVIGNSCRLTCHSIFLDVVNLDVTHGRVGGTKYFQGEHCPIRNSISPSKGVTSAHSLSDQNGQNDRNMLGSA